jgi:hypothetical protein
MLLILKDPDPVFSVNADPCPVPNPDQKILQLKKSFFDENCNLFISRPS